jgi:macrodomain Ter protein organizer (MatP/YcbG family)
MIAPYAFEELKNEDKYKTDIESLKEDIQILLE